MNKIKVINKFLFFSIIYLLSLNKTFPQQTFIRDTIYKTNEVNVIYQAERNSPISFLDIYSEALKMKSIGQEPSFLLASETPSITVYSDAGNMQGYSYFRLRGIDQTRINMTFDGVPLNEPEDQGAYFSNYPDIFNSLSKIQIQRGVGTTKNGSSCFGGSVELMSPDYKVSTNTTIGCGYGNYNSFRTFGEFKSGSNNQEIYLRVSQLFSYGYKYNSSNNSQSIFLSACKFDENIKWKINILAGHQKNQLAWIGVSDSLISIDRRINANKNENDEFTQCLTQIQNTYKINDLSTINSSIYYTLLDGNYDFNLNNFLGLASTDELFNYAFKSNLIGFFSNYTLIKDNLKLTTGIHTNFYNRQHIGSEKFLGRLYENTGYKNDLSLFCKIDYSINLLSFYLDVQYRNSSFDYEGSVSFNKITWHFLNPKVGLSFETSKNSILYYSIGNSGREPTRNDIFGGNDDLLIDSLGKALIKNQSPEYVLDQELGYRNQSENFDLNINLYYMIFNNEIVLDGKFGTNGLALTNNIEESIRTGVELTANYRINSSINLINNSSFNFSRIKEQGLTFKPILTPPLIINQEITYNISWFLIGFSLRYQDQSFIDYANSEFISQYLLLNSRIEFGFKSLQITIFLNNITDSKYFNNGYIDFDGTKKYFVQTPFNFYISLKYNL